MQSIVIPVDGSIPAKHALKYVISLIKEGLHTAVHVINIQPDLLPLGDLVLMDMDIVERNQQAQSEKIMKSACKLLSDSGVDYKSEISRGPIALGIVNYAKKHRCNSIIMGTRGMGMIGNLVLGSTANQVVHLAKIPVTLIK